VTEDEWLNSTDPQAMLTFLRDSGKASDRKMRLLACACVRRLWTLLQDDRSRQAVSAAESFSDGALSVEKLAHAFAAAAEVYRTAGLQTPNQLATARAAGDTAAPSAWDAASEAVRPLQYLHCHLCREIVGNPFYPLRRPAHALLARHDRTVIRLATAVYEDRLLPAGTLRADRLAILADALEDAGSSDAGLLAHLRSPGPHVRGCVAVDAILGRC
jgi:hypothetical protein